MKKIYIILSLFLSLSIGRECGYDLYRPLYENFLNCDSDCDSFCKDETYDHFGFDLDGDGVFGNKDETCIADDTQACGDDFGEPSNLA